MNKSKLNRVKRFFFFIPMMLIGISTIGFVVMQLWNWLMPVIFALPRITFLQALGLFVLSKLLFGSFNINRKKNSMPFGNAAFKEKMLDMSDDEREAFKEQWKQRCS